MRIHRLSSDLFRDLCYPKDQALQIAISAISEFLLNHEMNVHLVVYDKKAFMLSAKLFSAIERYIDDNYVEEHHHRTRDRVIEDYEYQQLEELQTILQESVSCPSAPALPHRKRRLEDVLEGGTAYG